MNITLTHKPKLETRTEFPLSPNTILIPSGRLTIRSPNINSQEGEEEEAYIKKAMEGSVINDSPYRITSKTTTQHYFSNPHRCTTPPT